MKKITIRLSEDFLAACQAAADVEFMELQTWIRRRMAGLSAAAPIINNPKDELKTRSETLKAKSAAELINKKLDAELELEFAQTCKPTLLERFQAKNKVDQGLDE